MGSSYESHLPHRLAPTSCAVISGFMPASTSIIAPGRQDDEDLLHPKPRKSILSKKDLKIQERIKRTGAPIWEPGTLIRLLPDAVHIKIDSMEDLSPSTPPPPMVPQRPKISLTSQLKLVGHMSSEGPDYYWYEGITQRGWHEGIPIFMRILPMDPRRFAIVYANGEGVEEQAYVEWSTRLGTPELRERAVKKQYAKVMQEIDVIDQRFKDAARQYRIARRLWEKQVVRHEFHTMHNLTIFRPGTTKTAVRMAMRMVKTDIASDC